MGYNSNIYRKARRNIDDRKLAAEKRADKRREEIFEKIPRARELEQQISACGTAAVKSVLRGGNAELEMTKLKKKSLAMQAELKKLLSENGYDENVLEPDYTCKLCNDTGFVEKDNITVMCTCFRQELTACACEELNRTAPLKLSTFESFDIERFSKEVDSATGIVPYQLMSKVYKYCKAYAQGFTPSSESILMMGATGLGKTHLSLAIANEVIKRGYDVIYTSAPSLINQLDSERYSTDNRENNTIKLLKSCDLLIIDDLGTEHRTEYKVSLIYDIFNSRVLSGKPVIISTNFTMIELEDAYSGRFVSRINGIAQKLNFIGNDQRIRRKP